MSVNKFEKLRDDVNEFTLFLNKCPCHENLTNENKLHLLSNKYLNYHKKLLLNHITKLENSSDTNNLTYKELLKNLERNFFPVLLAPLINREETFSQWIKKSISFDLPLSQNHTSTERQSSIFQFQYLSSNNSNYLRAFSAYLEKATISFKDQWNYFLELGIGKELMTSYTQLFLEDIKNDLYTNGLQNSLFSKFIYSTPNNLNLESSSQKNMKKNIFHNLLLILNDYFLEPNTDKNLFFTQFNDILPHFHMSIEKLEPSFSKTEPYISFMKNIFDHMDHDTKAIIFDNISNYLSPQNLLKFQQKMGNSLNNFNEDLFVETNKIIYHKYLNYETYKEGLIFTNYDFLKFLKSKKSSLFSLEEDRFIETESQIKITTTFNLILSHSEIVSCMNNMEVSNLTHVTEDLFNKRISELNDKKQRSLDLHEKLNHQDKNKEQDKNNIARKKI